MMLQGVCVCDVTGVGVTLQGVCDVTGCVYVMLQGVCVCGGG